MTKREMKGAIEAEERFRVDVQQGIHLVMSERGITKTILAERLGVSQARVSGIFASRMNLTIRTLARVFHALQDEVGLTSRVLVGLGVNFLETTAIGVGTIAASRTAAVDWTATGRLDDSRGHYNRAAHDGSSGDCTPCAA